jgi:hypothetical protein
MGVPDGMGVGGACAASARRAEAAVKSTLPDRGELPADSGKGWGFGISASHAFDWYQASSSAGTRGRSFANPAGSFIFSSAATLEDTIGAAAACSDVLAVLASLRRGLVSIPD